MTLGSQVTRQRRAWLIAAGSIGAAAAALAAPNPASSPGSASGTMFAAFASGALVAVCLLPFAIKPDTRQWVWTLVALVALVLGLGSFAAGGYAQRTCTASYSGRRVIVGTEPTELGAAYRAQNPDLSRDELLFDAAGVPDKLWTEASIGRCRLLLGATHFLWIPFLSVSLIAAVAATPLASRAWALRPAAGASPGAPQTALQYDVFISYRHGGADGLMARRLLDVLEADGYVVAIDDRDFPANASFLQEMERCIRGSRFTVAIISSRYLESGNCEEEAIICKVLDMGDRRRRLIPFLVEAVPLPVWLYGIVGIDGTRQDPLVDPIDKLKATLGAPLRSAVHRSIA